MDSPEPATAPPEPPSFETDNNWYDSSYVLAQGLEVRELVPEQGKMSWSELMNLWRRVWAG